MTTGEALPSEPSQLSNVTQTTHAAEEDIETEIWQNNSDTYNESQ